MTEKTLKLKQKPPEEPLNMRFIERKGRYILQELVREEVFSDGVFESVSSRWRDVPLIKGVTQ
jgi:hypothetical protein